MGFFKIVKKDMIHYFFPLSNSIDRILKPKHFFIAFLAIEMRLVLSYRIQNYLWLNGYKKLAYLFYLRSKWKYKCDIIPSAIIGEGMRIGHASDIVIGPDVTIGTNATIFNGVTIGNRYVDKENAMPRIGNNVMIGTGAKLLGSFKIGNDVKIGANAIVFKNVKDKEIVVGVYK